MSIELTEEQKNVVHICVERYKKGERYTVFSGPAGSGKSECVKFIVAALGVDPDRDVVYTSFTGRATKILAEKGNKNTSTLHKLLYQHRPTPDGGYIRTKKSFIEYPIVIVDEVGMVSKELIEDLFSHKECHVICCGDEHQLPPVEKNQDNHLLDSPHARLTEIHRQAAQSEIIQLATKIRLGEEVPYMRGQEVQVIHKSELNTGMLLWADQVLCSTNNIRIALNKQIRELLGFKGGPQEGEKVICIRNYDEIYNDNMNGLVNGSIGYLNNCFQTYLNLPYWLGGDVVKILSTDVNCEDGEFHNLRLDNSLLETGEKSLSSKVEFKMKKNSRFKYQVPLEFLFGYAITAHKSQGGEWDNVLVIEENFPFNKEEHRRWLYTAVTRAKKKLVLVRND